MRAQSANSAGSGSGAAGGSWSSPAAEAQRRREVCDGPSPLAKAGHRGQFSDVETTEARDRARLSWPCRFTRVAGWQQWPDAVPPAPGVASAAALRRGEEDAAGGGDVSEPFPAAPRGLHAGAAIALADGEPAKACAHAHRLTQGGRIRNRNRRLVGATEERLAHELFESRGPGNVGDLASAPGKHHHSPWNDHVHRQRALEALRGSRLSLLDLPATLERAVNDLDLPPAEVPPSDSFR